MRKRRAALCGIIALAACMVCWTLYMRPEPSLRVESTEQVEASCVQRQTLIYTRCGHVVRRSVETPAHWIGLNRAQIEANLPEGWRLTAFAPRRLQMTCTLALFCPQHVVVQADTDGAIDLWENAYGEAMRRLASTGRRTTGLPEETRWALEQGMPFDTRVAAEAYVEALFAATTP